MPTITKLFAMQEVSEHNTKEDCWVVIDGKVYDVTTYLDEHPGGDDVFFDVAGKDANEEFEDAGHSDSARELMEMFCIGELDPSSATLPKPKPEPNVNAKEPGLTQKLKEAPLQYWAVPVAIIGISVALGFLFLRKKC
ncbi:hypothetical protein V2J09_020033 [Rumex salicifolius]